MRGNVYTGHRHTWHMFGMSITLLIVMVLSGAVRSSASTSISEGYVADGPVSIGSIVSLKKDTTDQVQASGTSSAENILGVVINSDSSLLSVTNGTKSQVQVATSGTVPVLVSDINGEVTRGDHITASPISGVGMKASGNTRVVGIAQGDVIGETRQDYKQKDGQTKSVMLGQVPVLVNVAYFFKQPEKTIVPSAIQNVANALAGRQVSTLPILVSAGIFFVTLIVVVSIIYSMIHGSIISVGRNPMSQSAIYRNLIQMSVIVLAILGVATTAIYLVLTRL